MKFKIFQRWPTWNRIYTIRILNTFFREFTTQSNTAFSFGTRLMVFSGLNTRNTRRDFMVLRFWPVELPLKQGFFLTNLIIKRYGTGKVQGFVISFPILCLVNIKWNLIYNWTIINLGILFILLGWLANRVIFGVLSLQSAKWMPMPYLITPTQRRIY